mgnify:CR=1 FL=1
MIHIKEFYNSLPELENKELSKLHNDDPCCTLLYF